LKKDWNAGIEVPSFARRVESVFVDVIQIARTVFFRQHMLRYTKSYAIIWWRCDIVAYPGPTRV
jgi:hypothetical protein